MMSAPAPVMTVVACDGTLVSSVPVHAKPFSVEAVLNPTKSFSIEEFLNINEFEDNAEALLAALGMDAGTGGTVGADGTDGESDVQESGGSGGDLISALLSFGKKVVLEHQEEEAQQAQQAQQGVKRAREEEEREEDEEEEELVSYMHPESSGQPTVRTKSPRSFEVRSPKSVKKVKYVNQEDEIRGRLFGSKPCKVDRLVRLVKERKQNAWMKLEELREMCAEVGYSGKSSVFSSVWCIKSSLYGRNKANGSKCEPFGHFFPYFEVRKDRPMDVNTRRPSTRQVTWVRLSAEFFS